MLFRKKPVFQEWRHFVSEHLSQVDDNSIVWMQYTISLGFGSEETRSAQHIINALRELQTKKEIIEHGITVKFKIVVHDRSQLESFMGLNPNLSVEDARDMVDQFGEVWMEQHGSLIQIAFGEDVEIIRTKDIAENALFPDCVEQFRRYYDDYTWSSLAYTVSPLDKWKYENDKTLYIECKEGILRCHVTYLSSQSEKNVEGKGVKKPKTVDFKREDMSEKGFTTAELDEIFGAVGDERNPSFGKLAKYSDRFLELLIRPMKYAVDHTANKFLARKDNELRRLTPEEQSRAFDFFVIYVRNEMAYHYFIFEQEKAKGHHIIAEIYPGERQLAFHLLQQDFLPENSLVFIPLKFSSNEKGLRKSRLLELNDVNSMDNSSRSSYDSGSISPDDENNEFDSPTVVAVTGKTLDL